MNTSVTIGMIGYGNMAQAMAQGLVKTGSVRGEQIFVCARDYDKLCRNARRDGTVPCKDAGEVLRKAEMIVLAVKPYQMQEVVAPLKETLHDRMVVCVAAGYTSDVLDELLLPGTHHISMVPNTPVAVGEGIYICEEKNTLTGEELTLFKEVFGPTGLIELLDGHQMSIAGTISGCGPAYAAMFMEALGDAAVLHGLPRALAYQLAGQMLAGTGKLLVKTGNHPGAMKDAVCSPGGTTIVGVAELERKGMRSAVIDAIHAVQKKVDGK